ASAIERYSYYQRLLGLTPDKNAAPDQLPLDRRELTEENFDEAYGALIGQYEKNVVTVNYPPLNPKEEGKLKLLTCEYDDLNTHSDSAQAWRERATGSDIAASLLSAIPGFGIKMHFWGIGATTEIPLGQMLSDAARATSSYFSIEAQSDERAGQRASK